MAPRRVAIIEDHGALRVFLRDVLTRPEWEVTGTAGTADAAFDLVASSDPDVAIVDLHLGSAGGGDALVRRLAGLPELLAALDAVMAGERYVSPQLAADL